MIVSLVRETDLADRLELLYDYTSRIRQLAAYTTRIWAKTFKEFQVFKIVYVVSASLSIVADSMDIETGGQLK